MGACPEKIAEFMEKKLEGKKKQNRRPRPEKSTKTDVREVDLQLKSLTLSTESDSSIITNTMKSQELKSLHNAKQSEAFIDLSSPSPPLRACKLAKHINIDKVSDIIDICEPETGNKDKYVDVIDICESESEASPEHEKKAKELRLFINSIRRELY
ncbi:uncharacterized protein A4U43_C07F21990 [Asparagus officinalis]|uniref:Uncharacterized protein n=1 Tax=Asparagus officinalis TaxID=4686 RepID=A0A5P1EHB3_ASPOF|nr:uncharacterized protein A4U43_C07F21990 [Asparagus officinalis]